MISTRWPAASRPSSASACHAVPQATGKAAAAAKSTPVGIATRFAAGATANSAKAPSRFSGESEPNTRSPMCRGAAPLPTRDDLAGDIDARSARRSGETPGTQRRCPARTLPSSGLRLAARTRSFTSPGPVRARRCRRRAEPPAARSGRSGRRAPDTVKGSVHVERVLAQRVERNDRERFLVRRREHDRRRRSRLVGLAPRGGAHAPAVAGLEAPETRIRAPG